VRLSGGALDEQRFAIQRDPRLRILIPVVVAIAFLMEQLDSTIITTAIPAMAHSLATTPVRMNLAVTAYVLALAVFIPLSGWFADRFGAFLSCRWRSSPSARRCVVWPARSRCWW
jgi:MFS family permease